MPFRETILRQRNIFKALHMLKQNSLGFYLFIFKSFFHLCINCYGI